MYVQVFLFPSLFATEIHFSPWDMYVGCKQKSYLLIAALKPDNKKLVSWYPLEKLWDSRSPSCPLKGPFLVLWWAIPFLRLIRPEEQQVLSRMNGWTEGRCARRSLVTGGRTEEAARWEQLSSCTDASQPPFPNFNLLPLNSIEHELPHPAFVKMTQMQMRSQTKRFTLCVFDVIWN